jgi:hypothetical protein
VRAEGLEPSCSLEHRHLKPACKPIPPRPRALRSYPSARRRICRRPLLPWAHPCQEGQELRSREDFETVKRLIVAGMNDCAIARQTGIPRCTVRDWRLRPPIRPRPISTSVCGVLHDFAALPAAPYSYLLGMYLGDGCISRHPRAWRLRIVLDDKYPRIIERCREAIDALMPGQRAATLRRPNNCTEVSLYSKHWPCLLPQHGPGRKHL